MDLFIEQTFATELSKGLQPYLVTDQWLESDRERAYIFALPKFRDASVFPIEMHQESFNHRAFGNMPNEQDEEEKLPVWSLLGFVDLEKINGELQKVGSDDYVYLVRNAHEYVAPIEMQPDEIADSRDFIARLNTKMFVPRVPCLRDGGRDLMVPVNPFLYSLCLNEHGINFDLSPSMAKLVLDEDGKLKPFEKFTVWCYREAKSFLVDEETRIFYKDQELVEPFKDCPCILPESKDRLGLMLHLSCHHPLYD